MQVSEIMTKNVKMVGNNETVTRAAQIMKDLDLGMLPVQKNNKIIGVLTDRDIVIRTLADKLDPQRCTTSDVMTPEFFCCFEDDSLEQAVQIMENNQIHRLIICDHQNQPVGVLSTSDLAVKVHNEHLVWEVMERICEPA